MPRGGWLTVSTRVDADCAVVEVADTMSSADYVRQLAGLGGLRRVLGVLGALDSPPRLAAALEFVLEGLHLHRKLNKERTPGRLRYRG